MVHYWSNGPSSQFTKQYNFTNLLLHQSDHGMPADQNFFTTSQGKGENDGACRYIKNAAWRKVLQNKTVAGDLESFVSTAKEMFSNFAIEGFKSNGICDATKHLPEHYKKHCKYLHSTQHTKIPSHHHLKQESCWLLSNKNIPLSLSD